VEKEWKLIDREFKIPYYAHVSIGWDNNPRFEMFRKGIVRNNTPENFKNALIKARDYADAHPGQVPLITINSWNEWTETSYLQPCTLFGYGYLEAVKKVFVENSPFPCQNTGFGHSIFRPVLPDQNTQQKRQNQTNK
jgi:hypothetical protein